MPKPEDYGNTDAYNDLVASLPRIEVHPDSMKLVESKIIEYCNSQGLLAVDSAMNIQDGIYEVPCKWEGKYQFYDKGKEVWVDTNEDFYKRCLRWGNQVKQYALLIEEPTNPIEPWTKEELQSKFQKDCAYKDWNDMFEWFWNEISERDKRIAELEEDLRMIRNSAEVAANLHGQKVNRISELESQLKAEQESGMDASEKILRLEAQLKAARTANKILNQIKNKEP